MVYLSSKTFIKTIPLSKGQIPFLSHESMYPNNTCYNESFAWHIYSKLDAATVQNAFIEIVKRHECYRTVFIMEEEPVQKVYSEPVLDFKSIAVGDWGESAVNQYLLAESQESFDLSNGPLFKVRLLCLSEEHYVLHIVLHHIVFDGWSLSLTLDEFGLLYKRLYNGDLEENTQLQCVEYSYSDFVSWQERLLQSEAGQTSAQFWKQKLSGELPVLELPADKKRPPVPAFAGGLAPFALQAKTSEKLSAFCNKEDMSLNRVLLALYFAFLHRLSGQTEIIVGTPRYGRKNRDFHHSCGYFVNLLPIRMRFSDNCSFKQLLLQVQEEITDCTKHQDYPFSLMVKEHGLQRDMSIPAVFQAGFVLQKACKQDAAIFLGNATNVFDLHGLKLAPFPLEKKVSKFDLTLFVEQESNGSIVANFEYNNDIFHEDSIQRWIRHFDHFIHTVLDNVEESLANIRLLSQDEEQQQLVEWNRTETAYPRNQVIQELFEEQVAARPEAVAVVDEDRQLTYGELNTQANRLAHCLKKKGVKPETLVGICIDRSADLIVGIMGILKAGGAYVPMDPSYPQQRLTYMAHDAGIELMVTLNEGSGWVPETITRICLDSAADQEMLSQESDRNPPVMTTPQNAAYVMYTSGSTGNPKGVVVEQRNVVRLVRQAGYIPFSAEDRMAQTGAIGFDASTFEVFGALLNGGSLYPIPRETLLDAPALAAFVHRHQLTTMWLTSPLFNQLVQKDAAMFAGLQHLIIGGDALSPVHVNQVLRSSPELSLWNGYGPTENTTFSTCFLIDRAYEEHIPIGKPIGNSTAYVVNKQNHLNPVGVPGELCLGGDGVARGYLNQPDMTADKFVSNPFVAGERMYRTGDWVKRMPDGNLVYLGRMDKQVKIRGFRIEVGEIEAMLSQHPTLRQASVVVREDKPGEKQLAAYLVGEGSAQEWRAYLSERLPSYMVPTYFVQMDSLPLTPNGKIDTRALPIPTVSSQEGYAAPQTPAEELVAAVWSQLLGVERIGIYDSFFDLGGHSLLATQAVSRLREVFGMEVAVRDLFQYPTIESLSRRLTLLAQGGEGEKRPPIQAVERGVHMPTSYAQQRLWFLDQLEPNSPLYNIPCAWRLQGAWKLDALEQAYDALIQRHEALRTVIGEANGEPVQIIREHQPERLPVTDLRHLASEDREREMKSLMQAEADKPFQLAEGPLIRSQVIAMGENDWVLMCTLHHIIFDGWSLDIFVREWLALYEAFAGGQP
ncbi:non-ribosomal peptide synthetase, partial [Paenibacillus alvei]